MPFPSPKPFRKKTNWLAALAIEAAAPFLRACAIVETGPSTAPKRWRKALILGDNHIGDLLYRSASLQHLKEGLPDCEFHYLAAPGSCEVLEGNPALTSVLPWLTSDSPLDLPPEKFAALREMGFDAALCTNSVKYWPELVLAMRLGIPNRAAYVYKGFSGLATFPIPIRYPQAYAAYFRDYVGILIGRKPDWPARPVIHSSERDEAEAQALWMRLGLDRRPPVTACFMTSRQPVGVWPVEKFGETLRALQRKTNTHIVLCGTSSDEPILTAVNTEFGLAADVIAGSLGIRALSCFLPRCSVVLTTDSGPRHIANAAGVPVAFIRNVWFNAVEAGVYVDTETDLCPQPGDGDRGDGAALLAAVNPDEAADLLAAILSNHQSFIPHANS